MATVYQRKEGAVWWGCYYVNGKRIRFSTGERTRRSAQKIADLREEEAQLQQRYDGTLSLLDAAARFFTLRSDLSPKTITGYKASCITLVQFFGGDRSLALITAEDLQNFNLQRQLGGARVAGRRDLAFLSSLYSAAKSWPDGIKKSPFDEFDMKQVPDAEERTFWLTDEEIGKIYKVCRKPTHKLFVVLAVDTGMRSAEMRNLQWSEVDLEEKVITLGNMSRTRTKGGRGRIVPLTQRCVAQFAVTPRHPSGYIFANPTTGKPIQSFKSFWNRVREEVGLPDLHIHDLRHTYCSRSLQAGTDRITAMSIVGHSSVVSFRRYAHPSTESLKRAVESLERHTSDTLGD